MSGRSTHHRGSGPGIDGAEHLRCDVTRPADKIAKAGRGQRRRRSTPGARLAARDPPGNAPGMHMLPGGWARGVLSGPGVLAHAAVPPARGV